MSVLQTASAPAGRGPVVYFHSIGVPSLAKVRRRALPFLLLSPSLLFLMLFTYLPILRVGVDSLYADKHGVSASRFAGLDNYARLFADDAFRHAALNNLVYALGTILPSIVLALLLAVAAQNSTRFNGAVRTILLFPSMVPLVAVASLFFFIFLPRLGLLDYYLAKLGIAGAPWLGDPDVALWSLIGITVWKNAGYYMLFYLAALQSLPGDVLDAAKIDGANAWQRLRHITVPLLAPTTAFVTVIALIQALTTVDHVIVLTKGGPSNSTNLLLYYIYQSAQEDFDIGKAAAATVVSVAVLLAISFTFLKTMERGAGGAE